MPDFGLVLHIHVQLTQVQPETRLELRKILIQGLIIKGLFQVVRKIYLENPLKFCVPKLKSEIFRLIISLTFGRMML